MKEPRKTKPVWQRPKAFVHTKKEPSIILRSQRLYSFMAAIFLFLLLPGISKAQNKVVAYVPNWINLNTYATQIDYAKLTHINIAFENPVNTSGDLSFNSQNNVLITRAKANNVKILMSIGGGAASTDATIQSRYFTLINASNRVAFATKLVNYVVNHNLDGLDVDLEGPAINGDYGAFIAELATQLKAKGKLCTSALSQGYGGDKVPASVFQHFDFINIMAYDGRGPWDPNSPGNHSTLDFAKSNTQYWINRGLPRAKAVLGVPFYGYGFGAAYRNSDYSYSYIVNTYPGSENSDQAGSTIYYNGIPTIKAKTNYAFDMGIGGIMIWSLDYDVPGARSLLSAIDQVFKARTNVTPVPQGPYNNIRASLPGKLEVENYDVGGQDVAYNDNTVGNEGAVYRTDDVDVQATTDAGVGYNIGWTTAGEWLEYSVNITAAGLYDIGFRSASTAGAIRMEVDGADVTGSVALPNTGAYQTWATTTKTNVSLPAGDHIIRLFIITGGFNLNYITVTPTPAIPQGPFNNLRVSLPGKIEAENYDVGGQGVAYNDLTSENSGGVYRTDAVDIQATTDAGAGYNVGWISDDEWLEYSVNVTATGLYNVAFRTASGAGALRMEVDGIDVTGTINLPNTGAYQTWATTTKSNVSLTAGNHIVRLFVITGGFNLNYIAVSTPTDPNGPGFLHAEGKNIVNKQGNFVIKAINLGNYMVQEGYMLNLGGGYQYKIKEKIAEAVGTTNRDKFYDDYLANFVTKADIDSIAKWGFNSVRLPMHYNLFTPLGQQDVYIEKGFTLVDNVLSWCKANKIYLILDLHAAPGGQSSGDISDYVAGQPSLWESQANRDQTVKLWRKFAERYANEEYIGGYDLINETNWTLPGNTLLAELMKNITTAIRQVDNNHILFIEGNSYANDYTGLTPKWDNNMAYSFHKYWNDNTQGSLNFALSIRDAQNVPIWLGEFGENSNHWIAEAITILNNNNIGWAIWPYKKMSSVSCVSSFNQPANWPALAAFINGGAKPSQASAQATLNELIENIKVANCSVNKGYLRALFTQPGNNNTSPFTTINLPGKIVAANYDEGKQGFSYSDNGFQNTQFGSTNGHTGSPNNGWYYRNDGVDIQFSAGENGPTIGWTENGEWLQYTVNVATAGSYSVKARVAGNGGALSLSSDGSTIINAATIPSTGAWDTWQTVTLGNVNLTAGSHKIRLTFTTAGFNLSSVEFSTNAPLNQAPVVSITSPTSGDEFTAPASVTITATANDSDGTVTKVEFYNGTTLLGTTTSSPYTFNWNNVAAGIYNITAKATDNAGASTTSTAVSITVKSSESTCQPATASSDDGNVASNVLDNNLATRWSANGDGQWIQFCLDSAQTVSGVQIASYNGNTRQSIFDVQISLDGNSWTTRLSNVRSSGTSNELENFTFAPSTAKYVRILGHGNTTNTWNSFTEVKIIKGIPVNQAPSVSITSPANNANFNAPASITINANAADADGSIAKVEFFNGTTLLGSDNTAPYSYTWNNVAAGTYTITVKATDNTGASTTSAAVTVKVNTVATNLCSNIPQYKENNGYVAGSKVQNAGKQYECKQYPYSGWCNGGAWAYAPGTGAYWTDAWTLVGNCSNAKMAADMEVINTVPNPFIESTNVEVIVTEGNDVSVKVYDKTGQEVATLFVGYLNPGNYNYTLNGTGLKPDIYLIQYYTGSTMVFKKVVKTE